MVIHDKDVCKMPIHEITDGLSKDPKTLPSKFFYDKEGSKLFDRICRLKEYYPTRTELNIMKSNIENIVSYIPPKSLFIEFGSGSSVKIRMILKNVKDLAGYVPVDISDEYLKDSVEDLRERFPEIDIYPVAGDYTKDLILPEIEKEYEQKIAFFPGSTLGNFTRNEAKAFLATVANGLGKNGGLLLGIDMVKDKLVLESAYNDKQGITARFNKNILTHLNNEFGFTFDISKFRHWAPYNLEEQRIEMYLISTEDHSIEFHGKSYHFDLGESILTEYSHKYTIESLNEIIDNKFEIKKIWTDERKYFSVIYLSVI